MADLDLDLDLDLDTITGSTGEDPLDLGLGLGDLGDLGLEGLGLGGLQELGFDEGEREETFNAASAASAVDESGVAVADDQQPPLIIDGIEIDRKVPTDRPTHDQAIERVNRPCLHACSFNYTCLSVCRSFCSFIYLCPLYCW